MPTDNTSVNQPSTSTGQQQQVDRVSIKPPPFWKADPKIWFIQLEAQFDIAHITSDTTKYNYVLSAIDTEVLTQVTEFLNSPPATDKYEGLKAKLESIFSDSREKKLRRLLSDIDLGDRKPSQLLNEMSRLGGNSVSQELLKTLWMARLPSQVQSILTTSSDSLPKLAQMADKIMEIDQPRTYAVAANTSTDDLTKTVLQLTKEVAELRTAFSGASKPRRARSRTPGPRRSTTPARDSKDAICWYHRKFQLNARKCCAPCIHFHASNTPEN